MIFKSRKQELALVVMAIALGAVLRISHTERLAVEHFDEGVYSSSLWYDAAAGEPYPMRHLYAPPLLPSLISVIATIPGLQSVAPFAPSLLFGCLTVGVMWWMARAWFGMNGGLVIVFVLACSDFHILFSRMAMTDVPALFWICSAVAAASHGLESRRIRTMVLAGLFTGCAWWTKYTGWLALAIVVSGSGFWWLLKGRKDMPFFTLLKLLLIMIAVAAVCWLPLLGMLQEHGGYEAVAENHRGYFSGFTGWQERLSNHIVYHFRLDSWFGAIALGIGMLAAGTQRWFLLRRSTWNHRNSSTPQEATAAIGHIASPAMLARFVAAAAALAVMACGIGTVGVLTCIGIGGIAGVFLWPTLSDLYHRRQSHDLSAPTESAAPYCEGELDAAPAIDPALGVCLVTAWFAGMILTTPMYHSYPRLSLPLIAAIWLAAAAGLSWWIEATINVARRGESQTTSKSQSLTKRLGTSLMLFALGLTLFGAGSLQRSFIWQDRTSLRDASFAIGEAAIQHATGDYTPEPTELLQDEFGIIHPDREEEYDEDGELIPQPTSFRILMDSVAVKRNPSSKLADENTPTIAIYGLGEPAVLGHLSKAGLQVAPVADLNFTAAKLNGTAVPTFLILGPYALRTPGLLDSWVTQQRRFEHVDDFYFAPGEIVVFNLFSPKWISQHEEVGVQKLELYRLKTPDQK